MDESPSSKKDVQRYARGYDGMEPSKYGVWVRAEDYDALEMAERLNVETVARLQQELDELKRETIRLYAECRNWKQLHDADEACIADLEQRRRAVPPKSTPEIMAAIDRVANEIELHDDDDPFREDLRTLVAAVRAGQPPNYLLARCVLPLEVAVAAAESEDCILDHDVFARLLDEVRAAVTKAEPPSDDLPVHTVVSSLNDERRKRCFEGECARTACTNRPAVYFNSSTHWYYCESCASRINQYAQQELCVISPGGAEALTRAGSTKTEPPNEPRVITPVFMICVAYESGFGHGRDHDNLPNPYSEGTEEHEAYKVGYDEGYDRRWRNQQPNASEIPSSKLQAAIGDAPTKTEPPAASLDAEVGAVLIGCGFYDRMKDMTPEDDAETIVAGLLESLRPIFTEHYSRRSVPSLSPEEEAERDWQHAQRVFGATPPDEKEECGIKGCTLPKGHNGFCNCLSGEKPVQCKCGHPGNPWHCAQGEHMKACTCECHKRAAAETVNEPLVPKGHFWRGPEDRDRCENCGRSYFAHRRDDDGNWCPVSETT